ncbi:hypothetical protein IFM89_011190 [Coptis chinensis]|uniref:Uncharacterized protein n=1 Tax=Coptis chinensis TaxID=261450 RepID=A0A835HV65_9MAGN|nr:hypothetical protein IFM89_011190 [Coptis chinensis]
MSQSGSDHESDYEENDSQLEENESQHEESEPEPTGPKKQVQFNSKGQPVGPGSAKFVSFIGRMARMHCPPTYADCPIVPETIKKHLWKTVIDEYDLSLDREAGILLKANISWKGWKYRLCKIKKSPDGIVTRTQLFVATHTSKDGSCPFPAVKPSLTVIHAVAPYKKIAEEEKRKREITDEIVRLVMQRLDEESTARKILEEKMEVYVHDHSELGSTSQARQSPHVSPFTHCLLKNFRKRTVSLGSMSSDIISIDSYSITIDDIFDCTAELYVGEGTLADISIGDTITWPKTFVESI